MEEFLECKVLAAPSVLHSFRVYFYVFGWTGKALKMFSVYYSGSNGGKQDMVYAGQNEKVDVLQTLCSLDKRYAFDSKYVNSRISTRTLTQSQSDLSLVFSRPWAVDEELPYIFAFKLDEGKLLPAPKDMLVCECLDASEIVTINEFQVYENRILYAKCQRRTQLDGIVCNRPFTEGFPKMVDWAPTLKHLEFYSPLALPGFCAITLPLVVALDSTQTKIVLFNLKTLTVM